MEKSVDLISTERISRCCIQRGNKSSGGYERTSVEVKEVPFPCEAQKGAIEWPKAFAGNYRSWGIRTNRFPLSQAKIQSVFCLKDGTGTD